MEENLLCEEQNTNGILQKASRYVTDPKVRLADARKKIQEISTIIEKVKSKQENIVSFALSQHDLNHKKYDWTTSYRQAEVLVDLEELENQKQSAINHETSLNEYTTSYMGHSHEHSVEKEIFDLSDDKKIEKCIHHILFGEYKYQEGCYHKAIEHFVTALSYSEYIFPESETISKRLGFIRNLSHINLSLLYTAINEKRKALESIEVVFKENQDHSLILNILCIRAFIHRELGNFNHRFILFININACSLSLADYNAIQKCDIYSAWTISRIKEVEHDVKMYEEREKAMAENMFRRNKNVVKPRQSYLYRDVQFDDLISEYFMPIEPILKHGFQ